MALDFRLDVRYGTESVYVYDATCTYHVDDNPGGWGTPNTELSSVESSSIQFWGPCDDTYQDAIDTSSLNFPNSSGYAVEILYSQLENFVDGLWKLKATVVLDDESEITTTCVHLVLPNIECCISKRVAKLTPTPCGKAEKEYQEETLELASLLDAAKHAFCNGDFCKVREIVEYLWDKCNCCCSN